MRISLTQSYLKLPYLLHPISLIFTANLLTEAFVRKFESIQCQAALAVTGAVHGTSQIKFYNELRFETMKVRQWFKRLFYFFKIQSSGLPQYLNDHIAKPALHCTTRFSQS